MKQFLLSLFTILFFSFGCNAQIVGDYRSSGNVTFTTTTNWQVCTSISPITWVNATVAPTSVSASNTITIQTGNTATTSTTTVVAKLVVNGTLNVSSNFTSGALTINGTSGIVNLQNGNSLTVNGNVTVNANATFNANYNPGTSSYLIVYGNYINNGTTDFWKATAIITGDLLSPSTSTLQNNGNVVVGGSIIGSFNTTGGDGSGQIYALNPNAIVNITPASIDNNVTPGAPLNSTDTTAIGALVNQVLYGICSFSVNDIIDVSSCVGANAIFTVSTNATSPTYQWQVNSGSGWVNLTNTAPYSGVLTATLTITNVTSGLIGNKYRARVTSTSPSSCTSNSDYGTLISLTAPTVGTIIQPVCLTPTGSVALSGLPTSGTWTLTRSPGNVTSTGTGATSTITGLASGTYTFTVTNSSGCVSTSSSNIVINAPVQSTPVVGTITQPTCTLSTGSIALSGLPATGTWTLTRSPGNITSTGTGTTTTIAGLLAGTYSYTVTNSSLCLSPSTASIVINTQPTTPFQPTLGTVTQPTCTVATGLITITSPTGTGMTYSLNETTYTNTTGIFTSVSSGIYSVTARNSSGCISPATSVTINAQTDTWDGTVWSTGSPPTSGQKIVFTNNFSSTSNLSGCSCQVSSANVVINSGHTLTITDDIKITGGGTLTFEDGASLVQTNDAAVNSGNITYKRKTTALKQFDYTYWSSPVASAPLSQLATNSLFYKFNPTINNWAYQTAATTMAQGVGYIGRAPGGLTYSPTQIVETSFVGMPNNGVYSTPIIKSTGTYNLIGNPYPSALDADSFIAANSAVINGTVYLWTHNTAITNNIYTSNDYAKYNYTGGVGTAPATSGGLTPVGKIAAGQGFFIEANTSLANGTYSATFNNSMRISGNNTQFFKSGSSVNTTTSISQGLEKHRVWLSLRSSQGAYNQMLLGYVQGATNDFDSLYDGKTLAVGNTVSIYTMVGANDLSIQGKSLPFSESDVIPFGYNTTLNGELSINLDDFDGLFTSQDVYLLDKTTNTLHDLKTSPYTFITTSGNFEERFELQFTNQALGTTIPIISDNDIKIINANHQLEVISPAMAISKVAVYDILGKLLFTQNDLNTNLFQTSSLHMAPQVVLVKITLNNQNVITKKTIIE